MDCLKEKRKELIEELGVYFENCEDMSPLAARIFSMLVLSEGNGVPFDEIVEYLEASKSSISTNLQLLQTSGNVTYCTRHGDRKRYFKIDPKHIVTRLEKKIEMWEKERTLHLKVKCYKESLFKERGFSQNEMPGIQYAQNYAVFIEDVIKNLKELQSKTLSIINKEQ